MPSAIVGLGRHLPALIERGGVSRPIAVDPVGPSALAAMATRQALANAGQDVESIELLIFATMTPDVTFPGAGCFLQRELGLAGIGALDVRAQCAGFLYGLAIADDFIATGAYGSILLVGGEVHSSAMDYSAKGIETARLFADGAGAILLRDSPSPGVRAVVLHCEGSQHQRFWCEFPASRQHPVRFTEENFEQGKHFPQIDFAAIDRHGQETIPAVIEEALIAAGLRKDDIDCFIISHLLPDTAQRAARLSNIETDRLVVPSARHGHLTAAALPVALAEEVASGRVATGGRVCLAAAGAGLCWGAAVLEL